MDASQNIYHPLVPALMGYALENGIIGNVNSDPASESQPTDLLKLRLTDGQLRQLGADISDAANHSSPGLYIGEGLNWANVGIVGYIVLNSRNVLEGLKKFHAYYRMVSNITRFKVVTRPDTIELCWQPLERRLSIHHRLILEGIVGSVGTLLEQQTGKRYTPKTVEFCWPAPGDLSEYERLFNTQLSFNSPYLRAVYDRQVAEVPCKMPNGEMQAVLENYVRERCHRERADSPHSSEVLKILKQHGGVILGLEMVADKLGTSARNLQIRLSKEGATFRAIRDQALCEQARLLLANSHESVEEISASLGFSEPAVFYRNFKRWTGMTPREFRSSA